MFESEERLSAPRLMIILEDCLVEPTDDNAVGRANSFSITSKT